LNPKPQQVIQSIKKLRL